MTTKQAIGYAAVGLILYELWKRQQGMMVAGPVSIETNSMSPIPVWGQQLSNTSGTTTSTIEDLMSIPQGPGGLPNVGGGSNFFSNPECILPPLNF